YITHTTLRCLFNRATIIVFSFTGYIHVPLGNCSCVALLRYIHVPLGNCSCVALLRYIHVPLPSGSLRLCKNTILYFYPFLFPICCRHQRALASNSRSFNVCSWRLSSKALPPAHTWLTRCALLV